MRFKTKPIGSSPGTDGVDAVFRGIYGYRVPVWYAMHDFDRAFGRYWRDRYYLYSDPDDESDADDSDWDIDSDLEDE